MEIILSSFSPVIFLGIGMALPPIFFLWLVPWGNRRANRCLSLLMVSCSIYAAAVVASYDGLVLAPQFRAIFSLQLIIAPLLYLFTCFLSQPDFRLRWRHGWHLLPAATMGLIWLGQLPLTADGWLNPPCLASVEFIEQSCDPYYLSRFVHRISTHLSCIGYTIAALVLLRPHLQRVKVNRASNEELDLQWLQVLIYLSLVVGSIDFLGELAGTLWPPRVVPTGVLLALIPLCLCLSLMVAWIALLKGKVPKDEEPITPEIQVRDKKYQTSSLSDQRAEDIWNQLLAAMKNRQPHLEAGLKINDLADMLRVPAHHLSETINGFAQQSFCEFVNQYRTEEAARLLSDNEQVHLSITDIGLKAGFNSTSTFFLQFKKRYEKTPRQFRRFQTDNTSY